MRPLSGNRRVQAATMALATVLATSAGAVALTATPAQADCTSHTHNANGEGSGIMLGTYNLKTGPHSSCGDVTSVAQGTEFYYHCFVENESGNIWYYGRVAGTSTYGWMSWDNMYDTFLDDDGDGLYEEAMC